MRAADVMTSPAISVDRTMSVQAIAQLLVEKQISGVPVIDRDQKVIGMISEGDLLHRAEIATQQRRSWWLDLFASNRALAAEFVKSHGQRADQVMTHPVITVDATTPLAEVAEILETRRIKRVPVLQDGKLVGIVSRADLVQALARTGGVPVDQSDADDWRIRQAILDELKSHRWASAEPGNVVVLKGVVHLWGNVLSEEERQGLRIVAAAVPGVRRVEDHTALFGPLPPLPPL